MTIKGEEKTYRLNNYNISINPISNNKLGIQVIDNVLKAQFSQSELTLQKIGTSTLVMALEGLRKEISIHPNYKKEGDYQLLQLTVRVQSPFLKTIQETIFIKKLRNVQQFEILDRKIKSIGNKLNKIKQNLSNQNLTYYSFQPEESTFNGGSYETLAGIKLKKGKYLITFSFQLKASNQWLYLYLGTESIISNSGFYVPNTTSFTPFTIRIVKNITEQEKNIEFTTNSASSYPVVLRNRIITAQRLNK